MLLHWCDQTNRQCYSIGAIIQTYSATPMMWSSRQTVLLCWCDQTNRQCYSIGVIRQTVLLQYHYSNCVIIQTDSATQIELLHWCDHPDRQCYSNDVDIQLDSVTPMMWSSRQTVPLHWCDQTDRATSISLLQ